MKKPEILDVCKKYAFKPQQDITTYELAWFVKLSMPLARQEKIMMEMPESCWRYLEVVE